MSKKNNNEEAGENGTASASSAGASAAKTVVPDVTKSVLFHSLLSSTTATSASELNKIIDSRRRRQRENDQASMEDDPTLAVAHGDDAVEILLVERRKEEAKATKSNNNKKGGKQKREEQAAAAEYSTTVTRTAAFVIHDDGEFQDPIDLPANRKVKVPTRLQTICSSPQCAFLKANAGAEAETNNNDGDDNDKQHDATILASVPRKIRRAYDYVNDCARRCLCAVGTQDDDPALFQLKAAIASVSAAANSNQREQPKLKIISIFPSDGWIGNGKDDVLLNSSSSSSDDEDNGDDEKSESEQSVVDPSPFQALATAMRQQDREARRRRRTLKQGKKRVPWFLDHAGMSTHFYSTKNIADAESNNNGAFQLAQFSTSDRSFREYFGNGANQQTQIERRACPEALDVVVAVGQDDGNALRVQLPLDSLRLAYPHLVVDYLLERSVLVPGSEILEE